MTPFIAPALSRKDVSRLSLTLGRGDFSQHITAESYIFPAGVSQALVGFGRRGVLGDSCTPLLRNRNRLRILLRNCKRMRNNAAYGPDHLQIPRKKEQVLAEPCAVLSIDFLIRWGSIPTICPQWQRFP